MTGHDDIYKSTGEMPGPVSAGAMVCTLPGTLLPCAGNMVVMMVVMVMEIMMVVMVTMVMIVVTIMVILAGMVIVIID